MDPIGVAHVYYPTTTGGQMIHDMWIPQGVAHIYYPTITGGQMMYDIRSNQNPRVDLKHMYFPMFTHYLVLLTLICAPVPYSI